MYLAQFNIARLKAPLDAPEMKEFVDFLEPVNRLAEQSPGFVWRLTADDGRPSTYIESPYDDPAVAPNLTVWEDIESFFAFTYKTVHGYFLKSRANWTERPAGEHMVMWWIPEDERPTLVDAKGKLDHLNDVGASPAAFSPGQLYDAEGRLLDRKAVMSGVKG